MTRSRTPRSRLLTVAALLTAGPLLAQDCLDYGDYFPDPAPPGPRIHGPGDTQVVAASGGLLCLSTDACVQVFDVTDPENPVFLAVADVLAGCMIMYNGYLYTSRDTGGLSVVDLAEPKAPRILDGVPLPEGGLDFSIRDKYLYVSVGYNASGLVIFDLFDPAQPQRRSTVSAPLGRSVCVDKVRAYLTAPSIDGDFSFVTAIDITDPDSPVLLGTAGFSGRAINTDIVGQVLYAATPGLGLRLFDVSSPTGISHIMTMSDLIGCQDVVLAPPYGYVTVWGRGGINQVFSLTIADPTAPLVLAAANVTNEERDLVHDDGWLYLATDELSPELVDARVPTAPIARHWNGSTPLVPLHASGVAAMGDLVYVGDPSGDPIKVFDLSDPATPTLLGGVAGEDRGGRLCIHGELLYQIVNPVEPDPANRLLVYSLAQPAAPQLIGSLDLESFKVYLDAGPGAVYMPLNGLIHIIDTSDPTGPVYVGVENPPGYGTNTQVAIADGVAYCPLRGDGILTYDVTVPSVMVPLGGIDFGYAIEVRVHGDMAVAASEDDYFVTLDVSDPASPKVLAQVSTPESTRNVNLDWPLAYIAGESGQLWIYDVREPANPVLIGETQFLTLGNAIDLAGPWVVSAMSAGGLGLGWRACLDPTAAPDEIPGAGLVLSTYPNPFNPAVNVSFSLDRASAVRLVVHDLAGRHLVTLASGPFPRGDHRLTWRGLDAGGRSLGSGTYLLRMEAGDRVSSRKVTLIR